MAITLYLPDGSTEYVSGNPEEELQKIIRERLGRDCEELYTAIISKLKGMDNDYYEIVANHYRDLVLDTLNGLHEALMKPLIKRKRLKAIYNNLFDNLSGRRKPYV